jgi:hypothetical protein
MGQYRQPPTGTGVSELLLFKTRSLRQFTKIVLDGATVANTFFMAWKYPKMLWCDGLPWATLGYLGLPWATLGYLGLPWATLGYLGLPWATFGYLGSPLATFAFHYIRQKKSSIECIWVLFQFSRPENLFFESKAAIMCLHAVCCHIHEFCCNRQRQETLDFRYLCYYVTIWKTECSSKTFFPDPISGTCYFFPVIHIIPLFHKQTISLWTLE